MTSNIHDERDAEMDALQDEVTRLRAELLDADKRHAESARAAMRIAEQRDELGIQLDFERNRAETYREEREAARDEVDRFRKQCDELVARLATVERERDEAREELAGETEAAEVWQMRAEAAEARAEDLAKAASELSEATQAHTHVQQELLRERGTLQARVRELEGYAAEDATESMCRVVCAGIDGRRHAVLTPTPQTLEALLRDWVAERDALRAQLEEAERNARDAYEESEHYRKHMNDERAAHARTAGALRRLESYTRRWVITSPALKEAQAALAALSETTPAAEPSLPKASTVEGDSKLPTNPAGGPGEALDKADSAAFRRALTQGTKPGGKP